MKVLIKRQSNNQVMRFTLQTFNVLCFYFCDTTYIATVSIQHLRSNFSTGLGQSNLYYNRMNSYQNHDLKHIVVYRLHTTVSQTVNQYNTQQNINHFSKKSFKVSTYV